MSRKKNKGKSKPLSEGGSTRPKPAEPLPPGGTSRFAGLVEHPLIRALHDHRTIILGVLTFILYLGMVNHFVYFQGGDNAEYLLLARALASGQGFTSIYTYPVEAHTKYPFFFPLMIAAIFWLGGEKIVMIKILIAACAALTAGATHALWQSRREPWLAGMTALLVATVPFSLSYSVRVLSEIPFAAFATLALWQTERALVKDSFKNPAWVLAVLFLLMAYFTRSVGITLAPAMIGAILLRPPWRERVKANLLLAGAMALPFLAGAGVWYLRGHLATQGRGRNYLSEFFVQDPSNFNSPLIGWSDLAARFQTNGKYYLEQLGQILWPFASSLSRSRLPWLGLALLLLSLLGLARVIRRRRGAPELFAIFYSALLLIWGSSENRFLIPLFPVLLYYWLKGWEGIGAGLARLFRPLHTAAVATSAPAVLTVVMLLSNVPADLRALREMSRIRQVQGFELSPGFEVIATNEGMQRILQLAVYLRAQAEPEAVIFARKPSLVALVSGRPALGGPFIEDPAGFVSALEKNHVTYIVVDEVYKEIPKYFLPAIQQYPQRFQLAYQLPNTQSRIYKMSLPAGP